MAVTQHHTTIAEAADRLSEELPGHRVEILQGTLTATPPADGTHALALSWLVADRRHDEAVLHTDPRGGEYRSRKAFERGTAVPLPESIGITLELPVDRLLDGDEG
ncbi:hypothetical protein [Streptomyces xanthophaeus]|uniref:hypothetical protein n=1 Tax=Streptomyces xanthophaeus TaxID=67385 RepID=UPI0036A4B4C8